MHLAMQLVLPMRARMLQADAQRKAERKKEVNRNKLERKFIRDAASQRDKPDDIKQQLQEIIDVEESGKLLTKQLRLKKKVLQEAYEVAARKAVVSEAGPCTRAHGVRACMGGRCKHGAWDHHHHARATIPRGPCPACPRRAGREAQRSARGRWRRREWQRRRACAPRGLPILPPDAQPDRCAATGQGTRDRTRSARAWPGCCGE
jgi:hypothetical protein